MLGLETLVFEPRYHPRHWAVYDLFLLFLLTMSILKYIQVAVLKKDQENNLKLRLFINNLEPPEINVCFPVWRYLIIKILLAKKLLQEQVIKTMKRDSI